MNRRESVQTLGWLAALAFLASWFLPVLAQIPGWAAFRYALAPLWPFRGAPSLSWEESVPQMLSALTNVAFAVLFALLMLGRVTRNGLFLRVAIACLLVNLYWFVQMIRAGESGGLLIGYYVWLTAFALLAAVGVLNVASDRRT